MAGKLNEQWRSVAGYEGGENVTHAYRTVGRRGWKRAA